MDMDCTSGPNRAGLNAVNNPATKLDCAGVGVRGFGTDVDQGGRWLQKSASSQQRMPQGSLEDAIAGPSGGRGSGSSAAPLKRSGGGWGSGGGAAVDKPPSVAASSKRAKVAADGIFPNAASFCSEHLVFEPSQVGLCHTGYKKRLHASMAGRRCEY